MEKSLQIHELGELFEQVQLNSVFSDCKTFPDCIPKKDPEIILAEYQKVKLNSGFNLKKFIHTNFDLPSTEKLTYTADVSKGVELHVRNLWNFLTRQSGEEKSSILPLPKPYVVPGGRFREIYYWDSYFTMLGLLKSDHNDLALNMLQNFAHLIDVVGYIPNGNRTYFLGRSQPPFFSLMVKLLSRHEPSIIAKYLPQLEKEYAFWMQGEEQPKAGTANHRVVRLSDGTLLNRYWDENNTPRPESYKEDVELSHVSKQNPNDLFRNLRAAAESGWDFSSRWFRDGEDFQSTHTTEIIPVDLNCLLFHHEQTLAEAYRAIDNQPKADLVAEKANERMKAIHKYCWNVSAGFFFDYDFVFRQQKKSLTLAGAFPLFVSIATKQQAQKVADVLIRKFLKAGGLTTTLENSGQQWDAPNGWAPLQWVCYKGLKNYELDAAESILKAWLNTNEKVFAKTGKMTEKYDVWNDNAEASGGEYPNQDGFGWTNGVYLAMKNKG
jgi:alpha,alpha-trehalase